jgi:hypothetical protein
VDRLSPESPVVWKRTGLRWGRVKLEFANQEATATISQFAVDRFGWARSILNAEALVVIVPVTN